MTGAIAKPPLALWVVVLVTVAGIAGVAPMSGEANRAKSAKCKHGRVPVKVNGKSRCRRLASVWPNPKAVDPRLAYLRAVLNFDVSKVRGRHGKHARSLQRGFGAAGRKAHKAFLLALPKALAMIDALGPGARASARGRPAPVVASEAACGPGQGQPVSPPGNAGGATIQATQGANGAEGASIEVPISGRTFRTTFTKCGNASYGPPYCPAANGDADTSTSGRFYVTQQAVEGGKVVSSQSTSLVFKDRLHGKVAADARLDYLDFERTEENLIVATGGVVLRGDAVRKVRVNMRTGKYDPAHSSVAIKGDEGTIDDLAADIATAMAAYRAGEVGGTFLREDGWSTFDRKGKDPYCATGVFAPASNTLKLRKGKSDQVSVYAKASDGGKAEGARWTVLEPINADFSPAASSEREPSVRYTVTAAPAGGRVQVTLKFTSTAGVGKAVWTQPTEDATINHIAGDFNGTSTVAGPVDDSVLSLRGSLTFDRVSGPVLGGADGLFRVSAGDYTLVASGIDGSGLTGCQQTGSKHFTLQAGGGEVNVTATQPNVGPYDYSLQVSLPFETMDVTRTACPPAAASYEGTTFQAVPPGGLSTLHSHSSPDGIAYGDSEDQTFGGTGLAFSWALHGTP
jgi:hypothetical protein